MTTVERIIFVLHDKNLTKAAAAAVLGINKEGFYSVLSGKRPLSDRLLALICAKFNVSDRWLRYGEGSVYVDVANESEEDITRRHILEMYEKMPPELQEEVLKLAREILARAKAQQAAESEK